MTTTINTHKTYRFEIDKDEREALKLINDLLNDVQAAMEREEAKALYSRTAGEIIDYADLGEVRSTLTSLFYNSNFEWEEY